MILVCPPLLHWYSTDTSVSSKDIEAQKYLAEPPLVGYVRPKNLREWLIRAALPSPPRARTLRQGRLGFKPCQRRTNCALCFHNPGSVDNFKCSVTGTEVKITQQITCTDTEIYLIFCKKDSRACQLLHLLYVGECGDGFTSSFTHRLSAHLASATNTSQEGTVKIG